MTANGKPRLLDNLIPLRGDTFGPQLAGWTPGPPVSSGLGCLVWADQMVPVGEGVSLAADVYTPRKPGRYPAVLTFAAYSKELPSSGAPTGTDETGSPPVFTDRGYVHIIATRRGMGRSQGESVIFFNDQDAEDHARIIEWAAAQPWCDGNVVTFGTSYYGMTQPLVATKQPPALRDYLLHGADNGYAQQPAVRYYTDGTGDYRTATDFPIPGSETVRLHPAAGAAGDAMHALTANPAEATGTSTWAAVPKGAPVTAGFDEVINQTVSYETRIGEDTEFCGPVTANLRFSCNEIDSHVVARLGRVDAAGTYHLLSLGTISPARRRIDQQRSTATEVAIDISNPEPLVPGEPVTLRFSLTPHPVVVRKGERLRFEVGSRTDLLRSDVSHGRAQFDMQVPPYFSRNTLHHGPETYVELQRVPAEQ